MPQFYIKQLFRFLDLSTFEYLYDTMSFPLILLQDCISFTTLKTQTFCYMVNLSQSTSAIKFDSANKQFK